MADAQGGRPVPISSKAHALGILGCPCLPQHNLPCICACSIGAEVDTYSRSVQHAPVRHAIEQRLWIHQTLAGLPEALHQNQQPWLCRHALGGMLVRRS